MTFFEIIGWLATVGAIVGVVLNNFRLRLCFLVWLCTNAISAVLHIRGYALGDGAVLSLACRDLVFMLLAIHGWWAWGKAKVTPTLTIDMLQGVIRADDDRLRVAAERVGIPMSCDAAEEMADKILWLRAVVNQLPERAPECGPVEVDDDAGGPGMTRLVDGMACFEPWTFVSPCGIRAGRCRRASMISDEN